MNRRDFLKVSGAVAAVAAASGIDFVELPPGEEALLEDTGIIRWNVSMSNRMLMTIRYNVVKKEIQRLIDYARSQARRQAQKRGWKSWKETVVKTTRNDVDGDQYEVVLLKSKSKLAEVFSRYVQRTARPGNGRSPL